MTIVDFNTQNLIEQFNLLLYARKTITSAENIFHLRTPNNAKVILTYEGVVYSLQHISLHINRAIGLRNLNINQHHLQHQHCPIISQINLACMRFAANHYFSSLILLTSLIKHNTGYGDDNSIST